MIINIFNKIERDRLLILYKLLHDALFAISLVLLLAVATEILIPGLISERFGFTGIILFITFNTIFIRLLGGLLEIKEKNLSVKEKIFLILLVASLVVILFDAFHKADNFLNLLLIVFSGIVTFLFYQINFRED